MLNVKMDFPIFKRRVNGKRLIYLDSAATSQKPREVIDAEKKFYEKYNANVHRSIHKLSEEATQMYEESRNTVAKFIGAQPHEIVFTKGTTEGINIVASSGLLKSGDEIITTQMEHHSNMVPWIALREMGIIVKFVDVNDNGSLNYNHLYSLVNSKTKLIAITHISNSLGTVNGIKNINDNLKKKYNYNISEKPLLLVDAAQSAGHMSIDVNDMGCDFLVFSGHKMLGPTGIGVLYIKDGIMQKMDPLVKGGDMIKEVSIENVTYADGPQKFEGGTQNIAGVIGLAEAIHYIEGIGLEKIMKHDKELIDYALNKLSKVEGIKIYGLETSALRRISIAFNLEGIHSHDVAQILSNHGIMIRSGHLCTQPLMKKLNIQSLCRASFSIYNDKKDIDSLVLGIQAAKRIFEK